MGDTCKCLVTPDTTHRQAKGTIPRKPRLEPASLLVLLTGTRGRTQEDCTIPVPSGTCMKLHENPLPLQLLVAYVTSRETLRALSYDFPEQKSN